MNQTKLILVAAVLLQFPCTSAQEGMNGHIKVEFIDASRGNRKIDTEIYYPDYKRDTGSAYHGKYPVICFAHGYLLPAKTYQNIHELLVSQGYIVAFPGSASGLFPSHYEYSRDIVFVAHEVAAMGRDSTSALWGIADRVICFMGHSMGGGAIFASANMTDKVSAVVSLAAYNTKPSAIQASTSVSVPTLIIAGGNDCITPTHEHQAVIYNFSSSRDKTYILIAGGTHCQMGNENSLCNLAEKLSGCNAGISREEQHIIMARYLIPWLDFFLKGDSEAGMTFDTLLQSDGSVEYLRSRPLDTAVRYSPQ